jgi:hypothetical protein
MTAVTSISNSSSYGLSDSREMPDVAAIRILGNRSCRTYSLARRV